MQINPDLETSLSRPAYCLLQIVGRALDVGVALILLKRPVSYRDTNQVEPVVRDLLEIAQ